MSSSCRWAGSKDRTVRLWDVVSGQCTRTFAHAVPVHAACASPDGTAFYSGGADGVVRVFELDWEPDDAALPEWEARARPVLADLLLRVLEPCAHDVIERDRLAGRHARSLGVRLVGLDRERAEAAVRR